MATILVVDDRPSNRAFLLTLLGFTGHRLLQANDGAQALELVHAERPDLIITDILMPTMDGYEFVQRLRADPQLAATRVIFYSAIYAERETIAMAASCGVHTVLGKPADAQAIFDAVNAELGPGAADASPGITPMLNAWTGFPATHSSDAGMADSSPLGARDERPSASATVALSRLAAQLQLEAIARAQADAALRESEHRLVLARQVFDSTAESIMMTDADANLVAVNPAFEQITGYREDEVLGRNPRLLRSGRHDAAFFRAIWASLRQDGQWRGEIWNRRRNGEVYPERISISAVHDHAGKVSAYVSVSSDLSALKAAHHQLDFLSNHDALTLLPNRALLGDRLQQALAAARQGGGQLALLLFNVDRLSRINDSLGHAAGDLLLREVARRAGAVAGPTDTVARLSGDDFVLLTACADTDDIIACAHRLIDEIAQPMAVGGHDLVVTASVGISIYPRDGATPGELLKGADVALEQMKEAGRNGFRFFKGEMNAHALRWLSLETRLRRAIERGELALHYQPQVAREGGRIVGMEALLRWDSPELGVVPPDDFIPLAEDTGLIQPIGAWVLRQACLQNKAWQDAGLMRMPVAVNVSAQQFIAGTVPAAVRAALAESGLDARWLEVELTESVMMGDSAPVQAQLAELRALGVSVSLDDFGTGYSSLGYLSRFALDKLKIDQGFVRDITRDPRSAAIARATIALAHGLSLGVVAEGVETPAQRDFLGAIGCDIQQGYLYSRPLAASAMAVLLRTGRLPP